MIRPLRPSDEPAVRELNDSAFIRPEESLLIERLRSDHDALVELVSDMSGQVIGHIMFSLLRLHGSTILRAAALGPMAVRPDRQCAGVGCELVRAGLAAVRERELPAVVVLGHPGYYPRFGFSAETAAVLHAPFSGPAFMTLELSAGSLSSSYLVQYGSAFGLDRWFHKHAPASAGATASPDAS